MESFVSYFVLRISSWFQDGSLYATLKDMCVEKEVSKKAKLKFTLNKSFKNGGHSVNCKVFTLRKSFKISFTSKTLKKKAK